MNDRKCLKRMLKYINANLEDSLNGQHLGTFPEYWFGRMSVLIEMKRFIEKSIKEK